MSSRPSNPFSPEVSKSKPMLFSPPVAGVSSDGLFSAQSTPHTSGRFHAGNSLFAGATPGVNKLASFKAGGRGKEGGGKGSGLFGTSGNPSFSFRAPGKSSKMNSSPLPSESTENPYALSPTKGNGRDKNTYFERRDDSILENGNSPHIFEDGFSGDLTSQDEDEYMEDEDDDEDDGEEGYNENMAMYGDDDYDLEEDDEGDDDTMQDSSDESPRKSVVYTEGIGDSVKEPGKLIIRTEELMEELSNMMSPPQFEDDCDYEDHDMDTDMDRGKSQLSLERQQQCLGKISNAFLVALRENLPKSRRSKEDADLHSAYYIASLILPLQHSTANVVEILRKWLYTHHPDPTRTQLTAVRAIHPNSAFSLDFWDIVSRLIRRAELQEATELLRSANWDMLSEDAPQISKPAFGESQKLNDKRYSSVEVSRIKEAVGTALRLLRTCPGRGRSSYQPPTNFFPPVNYAIDAPGTPADWRIWRGQVLKASEELKGVVYDDYDDHTEDSYINAYQEHRAGSYGFGIRGDSARQQKAKVPTDISRALRSIYEIMRGEDDAIVQSADSWQEAVVGLMMWTKDVDSPAAVQEEEFEDSLDFAAMRPGEYYAVLAYRKKRQMNALTEVLNKIGEDMPLNPTQKREITAGGAMAGDPAFIVELSRYSELVTSAVIEIGGWGGWVKREPTTNPKSAVHAASMGLDDDDMTVLAGMGVNGADEEAKTSDDVMRRYASSLYGTKWVNEDAEVEGWEVGVGILQRVKDGKKLAGRLLTQLQLTSTPRVEKLLTYCTETKLTTAAATISHIWAQHLSSKSTSSPTAPTPYGDILYFLSLAAPTISSARSTLHSVITDLIHRTLSSSSVYPSKLDPRLNLLLSSPDVCTSDILRFELSGYAALRNFYMLQYSAPESAVKALTAVIRSAGEPIDGGLWDREWESPVEPAVLPLLWKELLTCVKYLAVREAMVVVKTVTDFEAAGEGVWKCAEDALAEVRNGNGGNGGNWVDVGNDQDIKGKDKAPVEGGGVVEIIKRLRLEVCSVLAKGWLVGQE